MCRLAYLHFEETVPQERRQAAVRDVLTASWNLGNKHGAGYVEWTPGGSISEHRALQLDSLKFDGPIGTDVLLHARFSTNTISLENTHPFSAAGAHLVHNGVVCEVGTGGELRSKAKTNNDSELILKAYLSEERSLAKALGRVSGHANVALFDVEQGCVKLFADGKRFQVWRQRGVTLVCQESAQTTPFIRSGLAHPYSFDEVPQGVVVEIPLGSSEETWDFRFVRAVKHPTKVRRPETGGWGGETRSSGYSVVYGSDEKTSSPGPYDVKPLGNGHYLVGDREYSKTGAFLGKAKLSGYSSEQQAIQQTLLSTPRKPATKKLSKTERKALKRAAKERAKHLSHVDKRVLRWQRKQDEKAAERNSSETRTEVA